MELSGNITRNSHIDQTVKTLTTCLVFCEETCVSATATPAYRSIARPTWSTALHPGVHTQPQANINWKLCREEQRDMLLTATITGSVTESRRVKIQLALLFKIINDLVDIPASAYLTPANTRTRANHTKKYSSNIASSHILSQLGILYPPMWRRLLIW